MTGLERVLSAVQGNVPDRPAVSMTLSLYGAKMINAPLKEYYSHARLYAEGQQAVSETFDADILFTPFTLASIGEAFGSQLVFFDTHPPNITVPGCKSAERVASLAKNPLIQEKSVHYHMEATELMKKYNNKKAAIGGVFLSPADLPAMIMGMEGWLNTLLFEKKEANIILESMIEFFVNTANAFFQAGAHLLVLPMAFCNPHIVTRSMVEKFLIPVLKEAFRQVEGPIVLHHVGLPLSPFLEQLKNLPNVVGYALDRSDSFSKARETLGTTPVLLGNIDGPTLYRYSPEDIMTRCQRIYENRKNDNYFILATSGADIPLQTPEENIHALVKTAAAYGTERFHES